jgi:polysaccharide export outer membrane protein
VILRKSVAKMQKQMLSQAILQIRKELEKEESGILQADLTKGELTARQQAIEAKKRLLKMMEKTEVTGRITGLIIPKNLELLKNSPYNILLEDGDQIFIPKKPAEVLVFGEVYNPSALVYQPGMTVEDYIKQAGGFTKNADIKDIFIIKPNGSAFSLSKEKRFISWDGKRKRFVFGAGILSYVPNPGEAIIVPTKIKVPIMWRPLIKDVVQILYQSALTVYTISNL